MTKQWFHRSFCGGMEEPEMRNKALRRACAFLNQHGLQTKEINITEGMTVSPPKNDPHFGGIYAVTVFYQSDQELDFEDIETPKSN